MQRLTPTAYKNVVHAVTENVLVKDELLGVFEWIKGDQMRHPDGMTESCDSNEGFGEVSKVIDNS